jgi:DNA-nicking Smr family endonuclease
MSRSFGPARKLNPPEIPHADARDENQLLTEAMSGVKRLTVKPRIRRPNGCRPTRRDDAADDGRRLLTDFIEGRTAFDWSFHPGYQEGGAERHNRALVGKLRKGGFSVQAQLDLHGRTQSEAFADLEGFLHDCRRRNLRCVRIVHGKGNNSRNQEGVLKQRLPQWLSMRRFARFVVAFSSAPPTDGGIGATYVLLRREPRPREK